MPPRLMVVRTTNERDETQPEGVLHRGANRPRLERHNCVLGPDGIEPGHAPVYEPQPTIIPNEDVPHVEVAVRQHEGV